MSWGNKLVLVFIGFAALMGTLVFKAVNTRFDLVTKDYYKDELRYQEQIDAAKNAIEVTPVLFKQTDDQVILEFPSSFQKEKIEAQVWFYCKADAYRDKKMTLQTAEATIKIPKKEIFSGNFEVKVRWSAKGKSFYSSHDMTVL